MYAIGDDRWAGMSKLIEEMGELNQVFGKIMALNGGTDHWDGDLMPKLLEELGDVMAAHLFFQVMSLSPEQIAVVEARRDHKLVLFSQWHAAS